MVGICGSFSITPSFLPDLHHGSIICCRTRKHLPCPQCARWGSRTVYGNRSSMTVEDFSQGNNFLTHNFWCVFLVLIPSAFSRPNCSRFGKKNKKPTKNRKQKTALHKNSHLFPSTSNLTKGILCICQYYLWSLWLNVERTAGQDGEWRKKKF